MRKNRKINKKYWKNNEIRKNKKKLYGKKEIRK